MTTITELGGNMGIKEKMPSPNWPKVKQGEGKSQQQLDLTSHTQGLLSPLGKKGKELPNYQQGKVFLEITGKEMSPTLSFKDSVRASLAAQLVKIYENCSKFNDGP